MLLVDKQANRLSVPAGPIKKSTCQSRKTMFILKYKFFWTHKKTQVLKDFRWVKFIQCTKKGVVAHLGGLRNTAGMAMGSQNFEFQDYMGVIKLSSLEFLVVPNIDQNCKPILFMIYIAIYMNM